MSEPAQGEVLAINGMTRSGSHYRANSQGPLHMASAWAAERRIVLGQTRAGVHSNEMTAIPEPLKVLELKGYLVTIDPMGFQKAIARQVVQGGADYLLALCSPFLDDPSATPAKLSRGIERHIEELFVFVAQPEVPLDNNAAERGLRHPVVSRKISGGTRSPRGSHNKMIPV